MCLGMSKEAPYKWVCGNYTDCRYVSPFELTDTKSPKGVARFGKNCQEWHYGFKLHAAKDRSYVWEAQGTINSPSIHIVYAVTPLYYDAIARKQVEQHVYVTDCKSGGRVVLARR